jgi:hypothetical protein
MIYRLDNMSTKLKLLYNPEYYSSIVSVFLEPLWNQYFERIAIDSSTTYDPGSCLIYADFPAADEWITRWQEQGFKIVIDHLWDGWITDKWTNTNDQFVLRNTRWFWHNECLWFRHLGYHNLNRNSVIDKSFLLLMNMPRPHRKEIYKQLSPILDNAIYSFHGMGIPLQNALDKFKTTAAGDRYTDIEWYNRTKFSIVVETGTDEFEYSSVREGTPWIIHTEKSYKPFAFKHPFVSWGSAGLLSFLKAQGFETYENLFDESYDAIKDHTERLNKVVAVINELNLKDTSYFNDRLTLEKLEHNYNLFYNLDLAHKYFKEEIVDPIYEFANK